MGGKNPPGYNARRRRLERNALAYVKAKYPDLYREAWQAAEAEEIAQPSSV